MKIQVSRRLTQEPSPPPRTALQPRRRDVAAAVVSGGASLLRAVTGAVWGGVSAITAEPRVSRPPAAPAPDPDAIALIYELLDAHCDTAELAEELSFDLEWRCHLEYLRALQRKGREVLAQMSADASRH
jgi:hypothetical protein